MWFGLRAPAKTPKEAVLATRRWFTSALQEGRPLIAARWLRICRQRAASGPGRAAVWIWRIASFVRRHCQLIGVLPRDHMTSLRALLRVERFPSHVATLLN
jgi:hypothetical protein